MTAEKFQMFENRLLKNYKHRLKQAKRQNISCWRLYDHDLPEFPVCIEIYENNIYLAEYNRRHLLSDDAHEQWLAQTKKRISLVTSIPVDNMYLRVRKKMDHKDEQYEKEQFPLVSKNCIVKENGLQFKVNLTDYLDSGLFLDHRITRQLVATDAQNKEFLNLFSYTGSFSVYAAAAGAKSVTSVDLSKTYLAWSQENFTLNALNDKVHFQFIHADVKQFLKNGGSEKYDLVMMDPPTFSNSKRMKDILDIQRDHVVLINDVLRILKPGGLLYFSTNFRHFKLDAEKIQTTNIKDITKITTPFDFEGRLKRACFKLQKPI